MCHSALDAALGFAAWLCQESPRTNRRLLVKPAMTLIYKIIRTKKTYIYYEIY